MDFDNCAAEVDHPTLARYVMETSGDSEMTILMNAMALSFKVIQRDVRKAGIADLYGLAGTGNASGDDVKKLDVLSNDIMVNALTNCRACCILVSEEEENIIIVDEDKQGSFVVAFDPLDGSSNIDCNVSTGTIFSVWKKTSEGAPTLADALRPGSEMVAAGYCMYGAATDLVLTLGFGKGVQRFTLDPSIGEFIQCEKLTFPEKYKTIYSCNEGNFATWSPEIQQCVTDFKTQKPKPFSARYVGSMVSDLHRSILYGGVFLYPADSKSPNGKLRLMYEGYPMAMLIEEAGGSASTGMFKGGIGRIMEIVPEGIHARCPIIMGNTELVDRVLGYYKDANTPPPPPTV